MNKIGYLKSILPVLLMMLVSGCGSLQSTETPNGQTLLQNQATVADGDDAQPVKIGLSFSFIYPKLTYEVDSVLRRKHLGDMVAPPGSTYVIVYLNIRNADTESIDFRPDELNLYTDDRKIYKPDYSLKLQVPSEFFRSSQDKQGSSIQTNPGLAIQTASVYLMPLEEIHKHPTLVTDRFYVRLPIWPERNELSRMQQEEIARKQEDEAKANGTESAIAESQSEPVSVTSIAKAEEQTSQISLLVQKVMTAEAAADYAAVDAALSEISALPKPLAGDDIVAEPLNKAGVKALNSKDYRKAVQLFSTATKNNPVVAKYWSNLGFAEMYDNDLASAQKHTFQSLALDSTRRVAWNNLGQIYAKQGHQDDAVSCFLVAYRKSNAESLIYLRSLDTDDDQAIRSAGLAALAKLPTGQATTPPVAEPNTNGSSSITTLSNLHTESSGNESRNAPSSAITINHMSMSTEQSQDYLKDLSKRIKRAWFPPKGEEATPVTVTFTVKADGQLSDLQVTGSSGKEPCDQSARNAVQTAAPFREFSRKMQPIHIQFVFDYNQFNGGGRATIIQ